LRARPGLRSCGKYGWDFTKKRRLARSRGGVRLANFVQLAGRYLAFRFIHRYGIEDTGAISREGRGGLVEDFHVPSKDMVTPCGKYVRSQLRLRPL